VFFDLLIVLFRYIKSTPEIHKKRPYFAGFLGYGTAHWMSRSLPDSRTEFFL
jgi:hypothetical protein